MNNIKLILQSNSVVRAEKINGLFKKINTYHPSKHVLEEYDIDDALNYTNNRMLEFISDVETIFDVADDIIYNYGTIIPIGDYETVSNSVDYNINHYLTDPFFLTARSSATDNYPIPAYTHTSNKNRFNAEGLSEFQVEININSTLPSGLYYIINTDTGIIASKDSVVEVSSSTIKTYIKQYTKIDVSSELLTTCTEPYAYVCNNNIVVNDQYIINVGSAIKEVEIHKIYISDVVIGRNTTKYPYTYEITNPFPDKEVKLSKSTDLVDCECNVGLDYSNPGDTISIVFNSENALAKNFKLAFKY